MKTLVFALVVLLLVPAVALGRADPPEVDNATPAATMRAADRSGDGYDCYTHQVRTEIPDNDPAGVLLGPISTVPGDTIEDLLLNINIDHTWIGDLIIRLYYSHDGTHNYDVEGCVLCRHGYEGCLPDGCCGCGGALAGRYGFDDASPSIENECPSEFPPGCYGPDHDSIGLSGFDGIATGGSFWLHVSDGAGGDVGTVHEWEICVLGNSAAPTGGAFDIQPGSCPNSFNVKAQGKLPAAILGTATFDATYVDATTVRLEGTVEPVWFRHGDVSTPVGANPNPCECNELGPDGYTDLKLKFLRQDIVDVLGPFEDGDEIELTLTGSFMDGTVFSLTDCIQILDKGRDE